MKEYLIVGAGGFLGSMLRYGVSRACEEVPIAATFSISTLLVNIVGCFFIGALLGLGEDKSLFFSQYKLFLIVGVLGGFTTFSAFGFESMQLLRAGEIKLAALNVILQVLGGLIAVWCGIKASSIG